jgi:RNA polymerase sigma factor (sigma-70 family)
MSTACTLPDPGGEGPRIPGGVIVDHARLIAAAIEREEWAWPAIVDQYTGLVVSVTSSFGLDSADAADVCQEVWTLLFENLTHIRQPERIAGWIKTVARNQCLRMCNRYRRETSDDTAAFACDIVVDDVVGGILAKERQLALRQALADLPDRGRALFETLLDQPGLTHEQLAIKLDMPTGSIGPTRQRCLSKLRTAPELARLH